MEEYHDLHLTLAVSRQVLQPPGLHRLTAAAILHASRDELEAIRADLLELAPAELVQPQAPDRGLTE